VPSAGSSYFHETVKGAPEVVVAGTETSIAVSALFPKREENQPREIPARWTSPQITTVMRMINPTIARMLERKLGFFSS
jgi:hypothetical protein